MVNLFNTVLLAIVFLALSVLTGQSFVLAAKNRTTIEDLEVDALTRQIRHLTNIGDPDALVLMSKKKNYPFDLGIYRNVASIFGASALLTGFKAYIGLLWAVLVPADAPGNGVDFELNPLLLQENETVIEWPPRLAEDEDDINSEDISDDQEDDLSDEFDEPEPIPIRPLRGSSSPRIVSSVMPQKFERPLKSSTYHSLPK